jgi:deazaflavin-dependent oxidoreductase (nitroreductase family)
VVVVAAGREEDGLIPVARLLLEAEHADVEVERTLDVRHLEMDVADVDAWVNRLAHRSSVAPKARVYDADVAAELSFNERIIDEFRANEGVVGGPFEGRPLLLLHHVGARSGHERVNPLAYQSVGDGYAIFGSNSGRDTNPAWYHNVLANPDVTVEVGTSTIRVRARDAHGAERDEIWERQKSERPAFADMEKQTQRRIPVVLLEPR